MAVTVTSQNEILLNGQKYRLNGKVAVQSISPFPDRIAFGDDSYANKQQLSSWNINDLRGGIGVEEMDEVKDWNKCWWTNCIIKYPHHILPPRLATAITAPTTKTATISNGDMELAATGWTGGSRSNTKYHAGAYSWLVAIGQDAYQDAVTWDNSWRGLPFAFSCWVWTAAATNAYIVIEDSVRTFISNAHPGTSAWVLLTVTGILDIAATKLQVILRSTGAALAYFDDAILASPTAGAITFANFNDLLYMADGNILSKLNGARTAFTNVLTFPTTIKALVPSLNSKLYVYLGDTYNYHCLGKTSLLTANAAAAQAVVVVADGTLFTAADKVILFDNASLREKLIISSISGNSITMTTNLGNSYTTANVATLQGIKESNSALANWGFQYDNKLFKVATTGVVTYSTDPDGTTPTWTTAGTITDIAAQIQGFVVGRDASGNKVPYAATKSKLKVYDSATPAWDDTEVTLPNHPNGGKGATYWNGKLYLSYGLGVKEYYPETGSFIDIGLTERDGLPVEYNGEITKLLGDTGTKGMFALIDASQVSGTAKSGLYVYDGIGWQCWWADTSNDGAMYDVIVSSASSAYAVYWDCGGSVYYIDIPRGIENPDKISQSYATAGILLSPWFDAGNAVASKLAKLLAVFAKGVSTTETVTVKYRTNHTNTDLGTGWSSALLSLDTTAENGSIEASFISGAGLSIKAIQFRLDFVTPGATAKADIQSLVFYYKKRTGSETLWSWTVPIVINDEFGTGAKEKWENLKACKDSDTDILFSYHPNDNALEQYYVSVDSFSGTSETGRDYEGNFTLRLIES